MTIAIVKTENGFNVTLPYELKDSFKQAIPSAKWNAQAKCWTIGPRSGKKAEIWAEQAQTVVVEMAKCEELDSTEEQFNEALAELENIKKALLAKQAKQKALDEMLADIATIKAEIAEVADELAAEQQAVAEKQAEVQETVNSIIDIQAVRNAKETMARLQGKMTSANRRVFEDAQHLIKKEREKLKQAGLGSRGLDDLWYVNWNRPDRDKVSNCRGIYEVYKVETE